MIKLLLLAVVPFMTEHRNVTPKTEVSTNFYGSVTGIVDDTYIQAHGGGGVDTNAVRTLVDVSFVGGTNAVNLAVTGTVVTATNDIENLKAQKLDKVDVVAPTNIAEYAGKAADAKLTGIALTNRYTKAETDQMTNGVVRYVKDEDGNFTAITIGERLDDPLVSVGKNSFSLGWRNEASKSYCVAIGQQCIADGIDAFASGFSALAYGNYSFARGNYVRAYGYGGISLGCKAWLNTPDYWAFTWNGDINIPEGYYYSKGVGSFAVNPVDGVSGFWIGETNLAQHIANLAPRYTPYASDPTFSNAVLAVQIDTNTVAQIGELKEFFDDLPTGTAATSLGGIVLALLGAAAYLKKKTALLENDGKPTDQFATDLLGKQVANVKANTVSLAAAYSETATYAVGDAVTHDGKLYKCAVAIATAEAWTPAHWTETTVATLWNNADTTSYGGQS